MFNTDFESDKMTAGFVYNRHFKKYAYLKDDLIQVALIKFCSVRLGDKKAFTRAELQKIAKNAMIDFLRTQDKFSDDVSCEEVEYDDNDQQQAELDHTALEVVMPLVHGLQGKMKDIVDLYLEGKTYAEISKSVNLAKSNVHDYINKFKKMVREKYYEWEAT